MLLIVSIYGRKIENNSTKICPNKTDARQVTQISKDGGF